MFLTHPIPTDIVTESRRPVESNRLEWLRYFDPYAALQGFRNHLEILGSSRNKERHTYRAYMAALADFCRFMGADVTHQGGEHYFFNFDTMAFPSLDAANAYMAYSTKQMKRSSKTVSRYMAAVREWLKVLVQQEVPMQSMTDYMFVFRASQQLNLAAKVPNVPDDTTSDISKLDQTGTRLTTYQVHILFNYFESQFDTLAGLRDVALVHLGIDSALRASEIARITLDNFTQTSSCWEIRVRGKRNKYDPVEISDLTYSLVQTWIHGWNAKLPIHDPRRITGKMPIFQPLRGDNIIPEMGSRIGKASYHPQNSLTARAILMIVKERTLAALGFPIGAHDMRRTCASLMRHYGFSWEEIQRKLRHKSMETTRRYVGNVQISGATLLTRRMEIGGSGLLKIAHSAVPSFMY